MEKGTFAMQAKVLQRFGIWIDHALYLSRMNLVPCSSGTRFGATYQCIRDCIVQVATDISIHVLATLCKKLGDEFRIRLNSYRKRENPLSFLIEHIFQTTFCGENTARSSAPAEFMWHWIISLVPSAVKRNKRNVKRRQQDVDTIDIRSYS